MARRRRYKDEENHELNLAPIMNMVMILIPLLLVMVQFNPKGVIPINSPSAAAGGATSEEDSDEVQVPTLLVGVTSSGFRVRSMNPVDGFEQFSAPIAGCPGGGGSAGGGMGMDGPPTVCLDDGVGENEPLIDQLDFTGLYNQLVKIRLHEPWFEEYNKGGKSVINIVADNEVPFEVLVQVMDTARNVLQPKGASLGVPTAGSADRYLISQNDKLESALKNAVYIEHEDSINGNFTLFPDPVLLMVRPGAGS
jgi:biopolymer transport protein ExbD